MKKWMFLMAFFLLKMPTLQAQDVDIKAITDSAEMGIAKYQTLLGYYYQKGRHVEKDCEASFKWLNKAAQGGSSMAIYLLSKSYQEGCGVEKDNKKALDCLHKAAADSITMALIDLGEHYLYGSELVKRDWEKSALMVFQAASLGEEYAQLASALYHFNAWGTEKSVEKARECLQEVMEKSEDYKETAQRLLKNLAVPDTFRLYEFEFKTLPRLLREAKEKAQNEYILTDLISLKAYLDQYIISHYEWDWNEVAVERLPLDADRDIFLYTMPDPKEPPLCKYMAAIWDKTYTRFAYFTLEKSTGGAWFFCGVSEKLSHVNYGKAKKDASKADFLELVKGKVDKTDSYEAKTTYPEKK